VSVKPKKNQTTYYKLNILTIENHLIIDNIALFFWSRRLSFQNNTAPAIHSIFMPLKKGHKGCRYYQVYQYHQIFIRTITHPQT
jgi:hypothetical protein